MEYIEQWYCKKNEYMNIGPHFKGDLGEDLVSLEE